MRGANKVKVLEEDGETTRVVMRLDDVERRLGVPLPLVRGTDGRVKVLVRA